VTKNKKDLENIFFEKWIIEEMSEVCVAVMNFRHIAYMT